MRTESEARKISLCAQYELTVVSTEKGPRALIILYENERALEKDDWMFKLYFDVRALEELINHLKWALKELKKDKGGNF